MYMAESAVDNGAALCLNRSDIAEYNSGLRAEVRGDILRTNRTILTVLICLVLAVGVAHARTPHKSKGSSSTHTKASKAKSSKARKTTRKRGQQAMDAARVREIQAALIREKYLDGQPTGSWDARSKVAMQHYQGANGWQTKMVPDSRALIKLGLGPDRANLINPETAATSIIPGGGSSSSQR